MRHCPGCACRARRLSDDLPASELIRRDAPPGQSMHGLCYLAQRAVAARKVTLRELLDDKTGMIHTWAHYQHFGDEGMKRLVLVLAQRLEARLG